MADDLDRMRKVLDSRVPVHEDTKVCGKCRERKPLSAFHRNAARADGRAAQCIACRREYDRTRGNPARQRVSAGQSRVKTNARSSARKSAARRGVFFDLPTSAELPDIPSTCPLCDCPMESGGDSRNNSPSLDRILPGLGYTLENVWWICHDCNRQKADLTPSDGYRLWDRVWLEIRDRGLPLPATRLRPQQEKTDE